MGTPALWVGFNVLVALMLAADLGLFHRRARAVSLREAAAWSIVWVVLSLLFNLALLHWYGARPALEFFTGYLIEKSLSADNLFVFALLFNAFEVPPRYQHGVLFWGVVGALVMRGTLVGLGVALVSRFECVLYLFGAFLLYTGIRMMAGRGRQVRLEKNRVYRWAREFLPITHEYEDQRFFVRREGRWRATPLLLVLLVVEIADLAFALDSIPAVFAVTRDPFIVYSSNVCALLGLRAFYFLLAGALPYFRYLRTALSLVLMLTGAKMLAEPWIRISTPTTLITVGAILLAAAVGSMLSPRRRIGTGPNSLPETSAKPGPRNVPETWR